MSQDSLSMHFYAPNSLSLDLLMRFSIPLDDMLLHSSFGWDWILCRNVPLLFVDALFCFVLF